MSVKRGKVGKKEDGGGLQKQQQQNNDDDNKPPVNYTDLDRVNLKSDAKGIQCRTSTV